MMDKNLFIELRAQVLYGAPKEREYATNLLYKSLIGFCRAQVHKYVFKISSAEANEKANDVLGDILVGKLQSYKAGHSYQSWISTIIHNKCVDEFRSRKSFNNPISLSGGNTDKDGTPYKIEVPDDARLQDDQQDVDYKLSALEEVMKLVTPKYRQVLEFLYLKELSQKEIVAITGIPRSTVGVFAFRGKKELKVLFRKRGFNF